ncbi:MAG TPA: hypothetical protein VGK81_06180, partial [Anaerolineae bacterium]
MPRRSSAIHMLVLALLSILGACSVQPAPTPTPLGAMQRPALPTLGKFEPAAISNIKLADVPVEPQVSPAMRQVYQT